MEGLLELLGAVAGHAGGELLVGEVELERRGEIVEMEQLLASILMQLLHCPGHVAQHLLLGSCLHLRLVEGLWLVL